MTDKPIERAPAEELRAAAAKLRETATGATSAPWTVDDDTLWLGGHVWGYAIRKDDGTFISEGDPAWIALAHPGLAEPLAAWLEDGAKHYEAYAESHGRDIAERVVYHGISVARVLIGDAQ